jgi:AcrR family transcriptional regulator
VTASESAVDGLPDGRPRRHDEILAAAGALFAEEGHRNTSMREVAAASGILAGSLYHHFPSKEAIAVELVEEYHADLVRAVRESEPTGPDPVANLRAFAREVAEVSHRHRAALQLSWYEAAPTANSEPASLDWRWRTLIGDAVAAGAIDDKIDTGVLRHMPRARDHRGNEAARAGSSACAAAWRSASALTSAPSKTAIPAR